MIFYASRRNTSWLVHLNLFNMRSEFLRKFLKNISDNFFLTWPSNMLTYLTILLASDFYYIFLCCDIALKTELSCKFPAEFCNLRWIQWTIYSTLMPREQASELSLLIMFKSIGSSNYLNKLRLSIKNMVRDLNKPRPLIFAVVARSWVKETMPCESEI